MGVEQEAKSCSSAPFEEGVLNYFHLAARSQRAASANRFAPILFIRRDGHSMPLGDVRPGAHAWEGGTKLREPASTSS